jgi:hypothetical protein
VGRINIDIHYIVPFKRGLLSIPSICLLPNQILYADMAMYDLLVLNGLVVTGEETGEFDIAVTDGKISKVVPRGLLAKHNSKRVIDAEGGLVMV